MPNYEVKITRVATFAVYAPNMLEAQAQCKKMTREMANGLMWGESMEVAEQEETDDTRDRE